MHNYYYEGKDVSHKYSQENVYNRSTREIPIQIIQRIYIHMRVSIRKLGDKNREDEKLNLELKQHAENT